MKLEDLLHILVIAGLILFLTACGKRGDSASPVSCSLYAGAFEEVYPDGVSRKSDVAACSDGCNRVSFVNDPSVNFRQCSH